MESLDFWRLCDELSIRQSALLIAGCDPSSETGEFCDEWKKQDQPTGYEAAKTALLNAFRRGAIKGEIIPQYDVDMNGNEYPIEGTVNINSTLEIESLRKWLASRGLRTGFFFPTVTEAPDYLDARNSRYAPKLAAAVRAWQDVGDDLNGKTPKQALVKWLREHAAEFGMTDDEGKPNETGIEEAAKMANWQPGGGAPKTPGE